MAKYKQVFSFGGNGKIFHICGGFRRIESPIPAPDSSQEFSVVVGSHVHADTVFLPSPDLTSLCRSAGVR